jgi:hypothetical protein
MLRGDDRSKTLALVRTMMVTSGKARRENLWQNWPANGRWREDALLGETAYYYSWPAPKTAPNGVSMTLK